MDPVETWLAERVGEIVHCDSKEVNPQKSLFDIGLDSFAFMQLVQEIESKFQIQFEPETLMSTDFRSIKGITSCIQVGRTRNA